MMRLRSDFWVSAYLRRCQTENINAVLRKRGAAEAGAIAIKIDHLDGNASLYLPAPQSELVGEGERRWMRAHREPALPDVEIETKIARQLNFDSDLWLIEVEDRQGRHFLDVVEIARM